MIQQEVVSANFIGALDFFGSFFRPFPHTCGPGFPKPPNLTKSLNLQQLDTCLFTPESNGLP